MMIEPSKEQDLLGVVLVGGRSRRMGRDKALMPWQGRTLLNRAVGVLQSCFERVAVIGPARAGYDESGVEVLADFRPGLGPLGGIHTALVRAAGLDVFVLACDLPQVEPDLVRWIVEDGDEATALKRPIQKGSFARVVRDRQGPQPLCGLYSAGCLATVEEALDLGHLSVRDLLNTIETTYLDLVSAPDGVRCEILANLNSPQELSELVERSECER